MHRFIDSQRRIERAVMHANTLGSEWNTLLKPEAFQYRTEHKSDGTSVLIGRFKDLPKNDLALELGEFFYQLRAALDGLIYTAAEILSAPKRPADENRLEFPIYDSRTRFEKCPVCNGPFPQELKDWLQTVQPYNASTPTDPNTAEYRRRLKLLHDCARKDRHRRLHIIGTIPVETRIEFDPPIPDAQVRFLNPNMLEGEAEMVELRISEKDWATPNVHFKADFILNINIAEMPGFAGAELSREFEGLANMVSLITNDFVRAFP
jgi:hypothetical protein